MSQVRCKPQYCRLHECWLRKRKKFSFFKKKNLKFFPVFSNYLEHCSCWNRWMSRVILSNAIAIVSTTTDSRSQVVPRLFKFLRKAKRKFFRKFSGKKKNIRFFWVNIRANDSILSINYCRLHRTWLKTVSFFWWFSSLHWWYCRLHECWLKKNGYFSFLPKICEKIFVLLFSKTWITAELSGLRESVVVETIAIALLNITLLIQRFQHERCSK